MKIIEGQFNTAKVFTDVIDDGAVEQIKKLCDQGYTVGSVIRIMPDVHAGAGCTIVTRKVSVSKSGEKIIYLDIHPMYLHWQMLS